MGSTVESIATVIPLHVNSGIAVVRSEGYRALAGLPSYDLKPGAELSVYYPEGELPQWLCLTVSRDVREDNIISLYVDSEKLLEYPADYVSAGQRLRIPIDKETGERLLKAGSFSLESSARLWIVGPNNRYPRLGISFTGQDIENQPLLRLRDSGITQFGWMHGCVLDGLFELYQATSDRSFKRALERQLSTYICKDSVNYESPRNKVAVNTFDSIELTLPFAVIAKLDPRHLSIDAALEYLASRTEEDGLITDGWSTTAEGCYTIAYPLMVIGRSRGDDALVKRSLDQLRFRKEALWVDDTIYLRRNPEGRHSFQHWARGVCWYFLGTVRTWLASGMEPPEADREHLQELAAYVAKWQNKDGLWRNFMDDPGQRVDTSGSSGIATALALCANRGWIDKSYLDRARKTHEGIQSYFVDGGFLDSVAPNNKRGEKHQRANKRTCEPFALGLYGQLVAALIEADSIAGNSLEGLIPRGMQVVWNPGVRGGVPNVPIARSLSADEVPEPPEDASRAIQTAMDSIGAPGAVLLPEGTFLVKQQLMIPDRVVLRGRGPGRTHLLLDTPETGWYGSVVIKGSGLEKNIEVVGDVRSGDRIINLKDVTRVEKGQLLWLFMQNDPHILYPGHPEWITPWAKQAVGQVFTVSQVVGNRIYLDSSVKLNYPESRSPGVRVYQASRFAGVEGIHFKRLDDAQSGILTIETAENCWVRDCEFENAMLSHVGIRKSRNVTVSSNYIHHGQAYSGGHAYGVCIDWAATDCLVENNILKHLRHGISTSLGANGNVWSYNYLTGQVDDTPQDRLRDISIHGNYPYMNLFEGNMAEFATSSDWWGAAGPLNTFFRNRFDPDPADPTGYNPPLQVLYGSHFQVLVGNSLVRDQGIEIEPGCRGTLVEGNLNEGEIDWNQARRRTLPPSLYLSGKPWFWRNRPWPGIGADVDARAGNTSEMVQLPAADWEEAIRKAGRTLSFRKFMNSGESL